jgi:hypothetical protein
MLTVTLDSVQHMLGGGARDGAVVEALRYKPKGRGSIPDGVTEIFY